MEEILNKVGNEEMCTSAIFINNGKILLGLRHYKDASIWTTPGGRCGDNETIKKSLLREIEEETSIKKVIIKEHLGTVTGGRGKGETVEVFLCKTDEVHRLSEPEKFSEWRWFGKDEMPENFINSSIVPLIPFDDT